MFDIVVSRGEQVLAVRDGQVVEVLATGRHRRSRRTSYEHVDVRERISSIAPQEILTADGVTVKVSAAMRWSVIDPVAFTAVGDPEAVVYLAVQVALREQLAALETGEVFRTGRSQVAEAVLATARDAGAPLGIAVAAVVVKDVVLPADLRAAYAELVATRQRGQAQLEAARAETAALRSMANAAKLLDDHPALARLRMIQAAGYGSKLVIGLDSAPGD